MALTAGVGAALAGCENTTTPVAAAGGGGDGKGILGFTIHVEDWAAYVWDLDKPDAPRVRLPE